MFLWLFIYIVFIYSCQAAVSLNVFISTILFYQVPYQWYFYHRNCYLYSSLGILAFRFFYAPFLFPLFLFLEVYFHFLSLFFSFALSSLVSHPLSLFTDLRRHATSVKYYLLFSLDSKLVCRIFFLCCLSAPSLYLSKICSMRLEILKSRS